MKNALVPILLAAFVAGCNSSAKAPPAAPAAVPAKVIEVQPRSVPIVVEGVGQVEGSKEVEVRARVAGTLKRTLYKEGDVVKPGTVLFQIDPEPFEIALAQSRSLLAQESARNEQVKREAGRLKDLVAQRAISQKEFDDATSNAKLSDAALEAAKARLREAELNVSYTTVTAPVGGVTGRSQHSEGSLITTSGADGLMTVLCNDNQWDRSNVVFRDGNLLRYDKRQQTPDMNYVDYGVALLRRVAGERLPDNEVSDLADLYRDMVAEGRMVGYEVTQRFYEIGSPLGLRETQEYLATRKGGPTSS